MSRKKKVSKVASVEPKVKGRKIVGLLSRKPRFTQDEIAEKVVK